MNILLYLLNIYYKKVKTQKETKDKVFITNSTVSLEGDWHFPGLVLLEGISTALPSGPKQKAPLRAFPNDLGTLLIVHCLR